MVQQEVSLNCVVAWVGWVLAIGVAVLSLEYPIAGLAPMAVLFVGAASVLHVRGFIHKVADREQNAFELGRDSERSVRSVR